MQNKENQTIKKEKDTLLRVLIALGITTLVFIITMTVIFCVMGAIPDTLVSSYFTAVFSEAGFCAVIQAFKIMKKEKKEEKEAEANDDTDDTIELSLQDIINDYTHNSEEADG